MWLLTEMANCQKHELSFDSQLKVFQSSCSHVIAEPLIKQKVRLAQM
jgi:hypothetical protein